MGRSSIQLLLLLAVAVAAVGHAFLAPTRAVHRQRHRTTTRMLQQQQHQDRRGALATGAKASAVLGALGLGFGLKGPAKPSFATVPAVGAAAATPKVRHTPRFSISCTCCDDGSSLAEALFCPNRSCTPVRFLKGRT